MGTYIVLVNSTDKGAVNVREVPNRQQTSRDAAAELGIVRKTVYMLALTTAGPRSGPSRGNGRSAGVGIGRPGVPPGCAYGGSSSMSSTAFAGGAARRIGGPPGETRCQSRGACK